MLGDKKYNKLETDKLLLSLDNLENVILTAVTEIFNMQIVLSWIWNTVTE